MIEIHRVHNRKNKSIHFSIFSLVRQNIFRHLRVAPAINHQLSDPHSWIHTMKKMISIDFNLWNWDIVGFHAQNMWKRVYLLENKFPPESDPALISRALNCRLFPGASECQDQVGSCHHGCQMVQCQNCGNSRTGDFMLRFLHIESTFYKFAHWIEDRSFIVNRKDRQQNCLLGWMYPWFLWITLRQCWGGQVQTSNISILKDGPLTPKPTTLVFCWVCVA
jgi:hypothetical protein